MSITRPLLDENKQQSIQWAHLRMQSHVAGKSLGVEKDLIFRSTFSLHLQVVVYT
jgi:hypothetical protein